MGYLISQRSHWSERELTVVRAWSLQEVLTFHAARMHDSHPAGFHPRAHSLKVKVVWSGLWDYPDKPLTFRIRLRCSDGSGYRLEWVRESRVESLLDVWRRVAWTGKGKAPDSRPASLRRPYNAWESRK